MQCSSVCFHELGLTEREIACNSLLFVIAGYDTVASTMSLVMYCLATNPQCQDKVIEEMEHVIGDEVRESHPIDQYFVDEFRLLQDPDYDKVSRLHYLQQVLDETLRLYPPASR